VRVHLAGKHPGEFQLLQGGLEGTQVLLDRGERSRIALFLRQLDERGRVGEPARQAI
jgi:hypothetical protein